MSVKENRVLLKRLFLEAFNEKKPEVLDEICTPDLVWETPEVSGETGKTEGLKVLKDLMYVKWAAFPDIKYSTEDIVAEDDTIACGFIIDGTFAKEYEGYAPTGKKFRATGLLFAHVTNGKFSLMRFCVYGVPWFKALGIA
jgi:predicted ester cyclase